MNGLDVAGLTVRFGGLVAVHDVSLQAPRGRISGLIGPNGAGKTTTFNACTGVVRPSSGRVHLDGHDVTTMPTQLRAQRGLSRTFQRMQLFDSLSVRQNVAMGREAGLAGSNPLRQLWASRKERLDAAAAADEAMQLCSVTHLAERAAGTLSTGQRRLVELARILAGRFSMLLLDEPSSGLDRNETRAFGEILQRVVADRGCGILLVEHDMSLVLGVSEQITVLDFGRCIFEGTPADVQGSPIVRRAYLGEEVMA